MSSVGALTLGPHRDRNIVAISMCGLVCSLFSGVWYSFRFTAARRPPHLVGFLIYTFTHAEQHQPPVVVERPQFCFSAHYMIYDLAYGIPYICVYYTMAQCDGEKSCLLRATRGAVEFASHLSFALKWPVLLMRTQRTQQSVASSSSSSWGNVHTRCFAEGHVSHIRMSLCCTVNCVQ